MKRPFRLVPDEISGDTVVALEELLDDARKGRLIGMAFAGMYRGRIYIVNTTGKCRRSHTFTRGMLADLLDSLSSVIPQH